jgi:hypothetical protein
VSKSNRPIIHKIGKPNNCKVFGHRNIKRHRNIKGPTQDSQHRLRSSMPTGEHYFSYSRKSSCRSQTDRLFTFVVSKYSSFLVQIKLNANTNVPNFTSRYHPTSIKCFGAYIFFIEISNS